MTRYSTWQLIKEVYGRVGLRGWELAAVTIGTWLIVTKLG